MLEVFDNVKPVNKNVMKHCLYIYIVCQKYALVQIQVHDNPASGAVEELPVEATTVKEVSSHMDTLDYNDVSNEEQALHVKAYGDGLGSGYAGIVNLSIIVLFASI